MGERLRDEKGRMGGKAGGREGERECGIVIKNGRRGGGGAEERGMEGGLGGYFGM